MTPKTNKIDILVWTIFIGLGFLLGSYLLHRDAKEGFGSLGYGAVPYFEFTDTQDRPVTLHMLKGKVWLVNFLSEEDTRTYPETLEVMKNLHNKFGQRKNFRLLTVTSDPQKLEAINQKDVYDHWHFLAGDKDQVFSLMKKGFYLDNRTDTYSSGLKLFLIDQNATIRGYYTISGKEDAHHVEKNLVKLL